MSKAICINKVDLFPNGVPSEMKDVYITDVLSLLSCTPTLEERATCETDFTKLQIIPYITLFDKTTKEIFVYSRGKASGEQRLAGKCSIGLGGHMETDPSGGLTLSEIIIEEALRELNEEVGIEITPDLTRVLTNKFNSGNFGIMYNTRTEVDKVHVAIAFFIGVDKAEIMSKPHEEDIITRGQWMGISDIQRAVDSDVFEIEHWTRMVLESLQYSW